MFGGSGGGPVFIDGRWWTVLSAGWLHAGALHILFNLMWVRQVGPIVADMSGGARMIIIYTIAGVCGFFLSSFAYIYLPHLPFLAGAPFTIGASAPIFGLLGALVHYGRRGGSSLVRSTGPEGYAVALFCLRTCSCRAWTTTRTPAALPAAISRACGSIRSSASVWIISPARRSACWRRWRRSLASLVTTLLALLQALSQA